MNPDFPVLLVETAARRGPAGTGLEELRAALGRSGVSTEMRPAGDDMTAFAQQSNRVSAFIYAVARDPAGPSAGDLALTALTRFVAAVRGRNQAVPIYLFGEQLSAVALPPPVLKEIHGFVNAFEDSADFVAGRTHLSAHARAAQCGPELFQAGLGWPAPGGGLHQQDREIGGHARTASRTAGRPASANRASANRASANRASANRASPAGGSSRRAR